MRIIFYLVGLLGVIGGPIALAETAVSGKEIWQGCIGGTASAFGGCFLLVAGIKKYRGHWPFVIGIVLITFAMAGLGMEIDESATERADDMSQAVVMVGGFTTFGVLLIISGHKLNGCQQELEALRKKHPDENNLQTSVQNITAGTERKML
jgi:hypothetical protein